VKVVIAGGSGALGRRLSAALDRRGHEVAVLTRRVRLMAALRRALHPLPAPPTPAVLVRLGAVLLRTDPALALTGRRAVPARLLDAGFCFAHPDLDDALRDLLARKGPSTDRRRAGHN
jgi:NAD dependent epimerase/dehydratase family enzyme